jgi:hypothetical protein
MKAMTVRLVMLGMLAGCGASTTEMNTHNVLLDLHHGDMKPAVRAVVEGGGYTLVKNDNAITAEALKTAGALWLTDSSHVDFTPAEIDAVKAFVMAGGTLICSGQAWSWVSYQKKDASTYALNQIGKALGFNIAGVNIGAPTGREPSRYLTGIATLTRNGWWPSLVESDAPGAEVLIRDQNLKAMALTYPLGKGRVFVFGHEAMLADNPMLVMNALNLQGVPGR